MSELGDLSREELQTLLEVAGNLATQTDQELLVRTILEHACAMTGSPDGCVLLYDPLHQGLFFAAAAGSKGPELMQKWGEQSSQRVPMESNAGRAFTTGDVNIDCSIQTASEHYKGVDEQTGTKSRSILSVPLRMGEKSIGVLQVLNKVGQNGSLAAYDDHDSTLLLHLGRLAATAINHAKLMRTLTAQMGLYSRDAADDLAQRLDEPATREQLTVLFADMRGFTELCHYQAPNPARTQDIMNDLFTMYADRVLSRGGIVNKFIGDAVLGIFRGENAPKAAVRCGADMLERFDSLRRRWTECCDEDIRFLDLGVGIATGTVALGTFGSGMVRDFTAIGTTVNRAHALVEAARGGHRLLIDNSTWQGAQDIVEEHSEGEPVELGKFGHSIAKYRPFEPKRLTPDRPVRVFVSHNHNDREFVETCITGPLKNRGIETWYSNADIIPGQRYIQRIEDGLLKCDWVVVLVSDNSVDSDWVKAEVKTAMADPRFDQRVLPLTKGGAKPGAVSSALGEVHAVDVSTVPDLGGYLHNFLSRREGELRAAAKTS